MIRNIVFDLGNVLISFRPAEFLEKNNYPAQIREKLINDVFRSNEWILLDNGDISLAEAIERITAKSSLESGEIARIFTKRTEIMFPIKENAKLLPALKKEGFKLYYLSNFPADIFDEVKSGYYFFSHFDGGMISADVRASKPGLKIFRIFLKKYSLDPGECLYIDDSEANVKSAESLGMTGMTTFGSDNIFEEVMDLAEHAKVNNAGLTCQKSKT